MLEAENDSKVERIVFAGHSLGGAVALLAYLWARANAGRLHDKVGQLPVWARFSSCNDSLHVEASNPDLTVNFILDLITRL